MSLLDEISTLRNAWIGILRSRDQDSFQCQLPFDVTISIDTAALHEAVMHHAQAEGKKGDYQPSHKQNLCNLEPR